MKESIFNIHMENNGHKLLFNSLYCGLCEIDDTYFEVLKKCNTGMQLSEEENELKLMAVEAGYFVEDDKDEIDFLKVNKYKAKFNEDSMTITIAPTLTCNFECVYCYEGKKTGIMTEETEEKLLSYISSKAEKLKRLKITWYGGEPLLAKKVIYRMSKKILEICKQHNILYRSAMITNGSLLVKEDIALLKECKIETVQITLDGPAEIHNARRICKSIENNFEKIINNMNLLIDGNLHINLRINVDKTNISEMEPLLKYLSEQLSSKKINIGFAAVQACTDACIGVARDCFSIQEFSEEYFDLYDLVTKYGFDAGTKLQYAHPRINYCGADVYHTFVVDPNGFLYKCWHDVGNVRESIGSVENIEAALTSSKAAKWLFSDATNNDECKLCKVLPLCMGGCPSMNFYTSSKSTCQACKYNISDLLVRNYYKYV